jgi:hypothetical protein
MTPERIQREIESLERQASATLDQCEQIAAALKGVVAGLEKVNRNLGTPLRSRLDELIRLVRRQQKANTPSPAEEPEDVAAMTPS